MPDAADPRDVNWASLNGKLRQESHGARFRLIGSRFVIVTARTPADREVAADPLMPQFQAEIARKAARLNEQLLRLKNPTGGLIDAARFLAIVVGQPAEAVADRIEILWGLYASLGAYMERNEETFSISRVLAPLDTTALRALRDLIAAAGQWIRAFPTGRRLDDAEQRWWSRSKLESATSLVRSTERKRLVGAGDAIIIHAALDAGNRDGEFATKARNWGAATTANLVIATVNHLAGSVEDRLEGAGPKSVAQAAITQQIENLLLQDEARLFELLSYLPGDVRDVLRQVLAGMAKSHYDDV